MGRATPERRLGLIGDLGLALQLPAASPDDRDDIPALQAAVPELVTVIDIGRADPD